LVSSEIHPLEVVWSSLKLKGRAQRCGYKEEERRIGGGWFIDGGKEGRKEEETQGSRDSKAFV
jgi:hypothetical protein